MEVVIMANTKSKSLFKEVPKEIPKEMPNEMSKETLSDAKMRLVIYLIQTHKLTLDDLACLRPRQAIELLSDSDNIEIANSLKKYVNTKLILLRATDNFFAGKKNVNPIFLAHSLKVQIYHYIKKLGITMAELGLEYDDDYRKDKQLGIIKSKSKEGIFNSAKNLFK